ncbi:MAG: 5-dehydro-4-deoxyglucarate dehydratase, partial [Rhodococcus fascians]
GPVRPPLIDISAPHLSELTEIVAAGRAVLANELAVH